MVPLVLGPQKSRFAHGLHRVIRRDQIPKLVEIALRGEFRIVQQIFSDLRQGRIIWKVFYFQTIQIGPF